jgi:hypothetical protein
VQLQSETGTEPATSSDSSLLGGVTVVAGTDRYPEYVPYVSA